MARPYYLQTDELQSAVATDNPKRFRKQLAYVDDFGKRTVDGTQKFSLTEDRLNAIKNESNRLVGNGIRVFGPIGHSNDEATNNHATWDNFTTGLDEKGRFSLFAEAEPVDEKARELVKRSDVSVFLDPNYEDGKQNSYTEVVRHVAFTPKPVIPDLGPFTPILASEEYDVVVAHKENKMLLTNFAKSLGITLSEGASEEDQGKAISTGIEKLTTELAEHKSALDNFKKKKAKDDEETDENGNPIKKKKDEMVKASESPIVLRLAQENWTSKIQGLSPTHISPATAKKLVSEFCSTTAVKETLSLSEDGENTMLDRLIDSLKENQTGVSIDGKTGPQGDVVELSEEILNDPKRNPLVASAMELAESRQ